MCVLRVCACVCCSRRSGGEMHYSTPFQIYIPLMVPILRAIAPCVPPGAAGRGNTSFDHLLLIRNRAYGTIFNTYGTIFNTYGTIFNMSGNY